MDGLLPSGVAVVEAGRVEWESELLPEEAKQVAGAVERRRREYAAGRACARLALSHLGLPAGPLLSGKDRAPLWPEGAVGSITHRGGYCAAAVARRGTIQALGIDAELNAPLPDGVARLVCTAGELAWTADADGDEHWQTLIFSAKESVYKAWQPLTGKWLGYQDVELDVDRTKGSFGAHLLMPAPPAVEELWDGFRGRYAFTSSHVLTAVALLLPPREGEERIRP